jgi:hypothetical protein
MQMLKKWARKAARTHIAYKKHTGLELGRRGLCPQVAKMPSCAQYAAFWRGWRSTTAARAPGEAEIVRGHADRAAAGAGIPDEIGDIGAVLALDDAGTAIGFARSGLAGIIKPVAVSRG